MKQKNEKEINQTKNGWKKKSSKMAKFCVGCAQVKNVSKNSFKESEYLFRESLFLLVPFHILEMIMISIVTIILLW